MRRDWPLDGGKRNVPIVVSIAAPTDAAVELTESLGVTLVGSARDGKMSVYSHDRRIFEAAS